MAKLEKNSQEMEKVKDIIKEGKIDEAVKMISAFLSLATEENYNERLENVIETVSTVRDGKIVIRFLIESKIIDIPALLQNISKKDSVSRYSFLYLLKNICENEGDLILPYGEVLLNKDPNIREAFLQLLLFVAEGKKKINDESLIKIIASNLKDEKEFVVEKASQVLKVIGKSSPLIINKTLTELVKESTEIETFKNRIDNILKSIVSIEKIVEEPIVETKKEIIEKEKKVGEEIKIELKEKISEEKVPTTPKYLEKAAEKIIDKEIELKKKDLEIKKKTLEIEEKEKQFEEETIKEREKTLKMKQELLEKEKELSNVELELKKKEIDEKEKELLKKGSKLKEKK